jgi:DNA-directed RNA polymerase beta subunit
MENRAGCKRRLEKAPDDPEGKKRRAEEWFGSDPEKLRLAQIALDGGAVLEGFLSEYGMVATQIESYEKCVERDLPDIVAENSEFEECTEKERHVVGFRMCGFAAPDLQDADGTRVEARPHECRRRGETYAGDVLVDVEHRVYRIGDPVDATPIRRHMYREVTFNRFPVMVRSKYCVTRNPLCDYRRRSMECARDTGGYFIVKGNEKILLAQGKPENNWPFVYPGKTGGSSLPTCEVRSWHETKIRSTSTLKLHMTVPKGGFTHQIEVVLPFIQNCAVPVVAIFKCMGVPSLRDVTRLVLGHETEQDNPENRFWSDVRVRTCLNEILQDSPYANGTTEEVLERLARVGAKGKNYAGEPRSQESKTTYMRHLLMNEFLPHIGLDGTPETCLRKAVFLAYVVRRMLGAKFGIPGYEFDHRDKTVHSRKETTGGLLGLQYRQHYRDTRKTMQTQFRKKLQKAVAQGQSTEGVSPVAHVKSNMLTNRIEQALATGKWGIQGGENNLNGVAQQGTRMNETAWLSHLRRYNTPVPRDSKMAKPRMLNGESSGKECPAETPEGAGCGLNQNQSLLSRVRPGYPSGDLLEVLKNVRIEECLDNLRARPIGRSPPVDPCELRRELQDSLHLPALRPLVSSVPPEREFTSSELSPIGTLATAFGNNPFRNPAARASPDSRWAIDDGVVRLRERALVFLNGATVGTVDSRLAEGFSGVLIKLRRAENVPCDVSFAHHRERLVQQEIRVTCDSGCPVRAVLIVENLWKLPGIVQRHSQSARELWRVLLAQGAVEFISKEEELTLRVAEDFHSLVREPPSGCPFTHCEIHPIGMLGVTLGMIPYPEFNAAPRNMFHSSMTKQAMGAYSENSLHDTYALSHQLVYAQKPIVSTVLEQIYEPLPAGTNVVAAWISYGGYNQEDAQQWAAAAFQRGLFRSVHYRTYKEQVRTSNTNEERFERPDWAGCPVVKRVCFDKIDEDGFSAPGTSVRSWDALIGKTSALSTVGSAAARTRREALAANMRLESGAEEDDQAARDAADAAAAALFPTKRECSVTIKPTDVPDDGTGSSWVVDQVVVAGRHSSTINKTKIRTYRVPVEGDKFASRQGQKGVCGQRMAEEDMPFTPSGVRPDVIINPHALPSRMTIGQQLEMISGKTGCMTGEFQDGTPFRNDRERILREALDAGVEPMGEEMLISGVTGEPFAETVFIGVCYYERLKHMAVDKKHARSRGPVQILTRQPVEGRSRDGGLRFGEMEEGCLIAYGASALLKERMHDSSDAFEVPVCCQCGFIAIPVRPDERSRMGWFDGRKLGGGRLLLQAGMPYCPVCCSSDDIGLVRVPYPFKLLIQELYAMFVLVRLRTEKDPQVFAVECDGQKPDLAALEKRLSAGYLQCPDPAYFHSSTSFACQ